MLWDAATIKGYSVEASDGPIGKVSDLLFEDTDWVVRWLVVDVGHWLTGRKVLLPPSVLGKPDGELYRFPVKLTVRQVQDSPDIDTAQPVSRQMETGIYDYYGLNPYWGGGFAMGAFGTLGGMMPEPTHLGARPGGPLDAEPDAAGDPHLRSVAGLTGYHIQASDGDIGHIENFLVEDAGWRIRYITVDTKNWWPGEKILISPFSVTEIAWADRSVQVALDRQTIRSGPRYDPAVELDEAYDQEFLRHYGIQRPVF